MPKCLAKPTGAWTPASWSLSNSNYHKSRLTRKSWFKFLLKQKVLLSSIDAAYCC